MKSDYILEDIVQRNKENPRKFLRPADEEIKNLRIGDFVKLIFLFDKKIDALTGERMWVKITEINQEKFKGILTNPPVYLPGIKMGDIITFEKKNIASIFIKPSFDPEKTAVITLKALEEKEVNWLYKDIPYDEEDSGWNLFHGSEDEEYTANPNNGVVISLKDVLEFEPLLEKVFSSKHTAFEWNKKENNFIHTNNN